MHQQTVIFGDITSAQFGIIVHGCNAQGVMGSGVALALRNKYPVIFDEYIKGPMIPGTVTFAQVTPDLVIANAITQEFYGRDGKKYVSYKALHHAMREVAKFALPRTTIHYPLIGAGLGGGDWGIIQPVIDSGLSIVPSVYKCLWMLD